jgi:hypothetical protein
MTRAARRRYARVFDALLARPGKCWLLAGEREARALAGGRVPWIVRQQAKALLDPGPLKARRRV